MLTRHQPESERGRHRGHARERRERQQRRRARVLRYVRTGALGLFLVGMIAAFVIVLALPDAAPASTGAAGGAHAGNDWVSLRSTTPAGLLAAMRSTTLYQEVAASPQTRLGQALRTGTLGTPVLVRAYRPTRGMPDVWVVPVLATGATGVPSPPTVGASVVALLDFEYDRPHARIRAVSFAGPFVPTDPEYGRPFPRVTPAVALARVQQTRRLNMAGGRQPQLVYFPANLNALNDPHSKLKWSGGGQFPDLAVWQVPATDGHDYLVGVDGVVYTAAQLPLAANAGP
ncbi:MAG TPA: hypothetical protein VKC57_07860 [Ktedonobacterales bacterium]|nr:hypothetical protein [Ktedonobacterales bacterium]